MDEFTPAMVEVSSIIADVRRVHMYADSNILEEDFENLIWMLEKLHNRLRKARERQKVTQQNTPIDNINTDMLS